jgi:hypothetical protein
MVGYKKPSRLGGFLFSINWCQPLRLSAKNRSLFVGSVLWGTLSIGLEKHSNFIAPLTGYVKNNFWHFSIQFYG